MRKVILAGGDIVGTFNGNIITVSDAAEGNHVVISLASVLCEMPNGFEGDFTDEQIVEYICTWCMG
jgi:energy-converting hydrogenase Eha subunit B